MSFLLSEARNRIKSSKLSKLTSIIDWNMLTKTLGNLGRSGFGPSSYDPVKMVKALLLQSWHNLSDYELEEALRLRLDFMLITEFEDVPDHSTICRFRNLLVEKGLLEIIFNQINQQLEASGMKVEPATGAIIDATIITSAARPAKEIEAMAVDRKEVAELATSSKSFDASNQTLSSSKDPDAAWLKKGSKSYYGYKAFVVTDSKEGFINQVQVTPANLSEVKQLESVLNNSKPVRRLYADKGYASLTNRELLKAKGIKDAIMHKAQRNQPLTNWQKKFNQIISVSRFRVEQGFGTLKRRFKFARASYFGLKRVTGQMLLKAMAFNLLKAVNKLSVV